MTKEEMKNRISMALKDPILQQGFEIICKENAELKKRNVILAGQKASLERWFGEAKEIIEGLMRFCRCFAQHHTEDIRYKEAEQFISGE